MPYISEAGALRRDMQDRIAQLEAENAALRAELSKMSVEAIAYRTCLGHYDSLTDELKAERDAARAWAAAWRKAATFWRGWRDMPYTYCRDRDFVFGGARRAAEAAEAQERR